MLASYFLGAKILRTEKEVIVVTPLIKKKEKNIDGKGDIV